MLYYTFSLSLFYVILYNQIVYFQFDTILVPCFIIHYPLGAVQVLRNQFWGFLRPPSPYVINRNHFEGPPPQIM